MLSPAVVRASLVSLAALSAAPALLAQSARETVYFTTPNNTISRANFAPPGTSTTALTDNGTNFNGLAVRYDGNNVVTLLAANGTGGGDVRAYRCTSPTAPCQKLGVVFSLKKAQGVALDTFGNLYAVNAQQGQADPLVFAARKPGCPTDRGTNLPSGCFPGGYGPLQVIDSQVDGVTEVADVKVEAGSGDVIVLASRPAKLLRYAAAAVKNRVQNNGAEPSPASVTANFAGQDPSGLALFPTGEIFVVTSQGSVLVFNGVSSNVFGTLNGQGAQIAIGVEGGAKADPVANGRVLVTVKGSNQVQSFGIQKSGANLVASPSVPDGVVPANVPFGVADASLSGAVYTPQSLTLPVTIHLPAGHEVIFSKVNTGGLTEGNFYVVSEGALRLPTNVSATCPPGESLTLEGLTRCVPQHVRGFAVTPGPLCQADGTNCYYLVYVADTGANVFGGTQQHHLEESAFGFNTTCYQATPGPEFGQPFNSPDLGSYSSALQASQPRVFQATDDNDAPIVEGKTFTDITTGCASHIGRGGQFSMFLTGWDERVRVDIVDEKLASLATAVTGTTPALGGLDPHITAAIKPDLLSALAAVQTAWAADRVTPNPLGIGTSTTVALDAFISFVEANAGGFTECPGLGPCSEAVKRNAPGELISRAESARFFSCGAADGCYDPFPPVPVP